MEQRSHDAGEVYPRGTGYPDGPLPTREQQRASYERRVAAEESEWRDGPGGELTEEDRLVLGALDQEADARRGYTWGLFPDRDESQF
jgi:hypothetical protein